MGSILWASIEADVDVVDYFWLTAAMTGDSWDCTFLLCPTLSHFYIWRSLGFLLRLNECYYGDYYYNNCWFWTRTSSKLEHPRFPPPPLVGSPMRGSRTRRCSLPLHAPKVHVSDAKIRGWRTRALSFLSKCSPPSRRQWANIFYIRRRPTHMYVQWISRVHSIPRRRSYCRIYARPTWNIFTPISACLKRKKGQDAKPLLALQNWFAKLDWSYQIAKHTSEPYWIVNEWQTWSVISNRLQITVMIKDCNYNRNRLHFSKSNRNVIDYIFDVIVIKNLAITNYKKNQFFREKLELLQLQKIFL